MKKILSGMLALLMCGMTAGCGDRYDDRPAPLSDVQKASEPVEALYSVEEISGSSFNAAFLKEIAKEKNNFVISPLSVKLALNMAALGAGSETEQELLTVFGYGSAEEMISDSRTLVSELDRKDGSITVNNSVWMSDRNDGVNISRNYIGDLSDIFRAELFEKNLSDKKIVKDFNKWVDKKTKGLIPKMISQPFDEDTRMLLVNTLYFKNDWERPFPERDSYEFTFYGVNGESNTMSMRLDGGFEYAEGDSLISMILPYEDGSRMKLYLPADENAMLGDIIECLSPAELAEEMELSYSMRNVHISMPRFECEYNESLRETLELLGISSAFDMFTADLSGMLEEDSKDHPLYISDVIHASKIKCGEKGTEAAAATVVDISDGGAMDPEDKVYFIANRPFLYVIESPSGEVLFMGIISDF